MKRTLITVLTLSGFIGAMVGCAKNDLLSAPNSSEVSFSTHVDGTTKGTTKVAFKIGDQFGLMATESPAEWSNTDASWYMGGGTDAYVTVTNTPSNGGGAWKYSPIKLWPEANRVSFFAYSPIADGANGISNVSAVAGSPTLDFVVSDEIKDQIDLLRAEALDKHAEEVELAFSHALTRVSFAAKANVTTNQRVRLDKIELKGIKNSGSLKLYDNARVVGALDDMGGWSGQTGTATYSPALTHEAASLVTTDLMPMTEEDQALFMIPQEFAVGGDAKFEVTYSYSNDGGSKWINDSKFEIDLGEYTKYWNPSKNYRYVLTLSPANVYTFSADIVDWDAETDLVVKAPFSVSLLDLDPTGGKPHEVVVTETRGQALGYTLKSDKPDWLTISANADGSGAKGELTYDKAGVVKAYEMEKKWYIVTQPNTTGVPREGTVTLTREGMEPQEIKVKQVRGLPFKDVTAPTLPAYVTSPTTKVTGMVVPNHSGAKYKIKTASTWYTLSLDGVGNGVKELEVVGNAGDTSVDFYIHASSDITRSAKNANIEFEAINPEGPTANLGTLAVKQNANTEYFVGNFAGDLKSEAVGNETHYYFDKLLFAAAANESGTYKWQNVLSGTAAKSVMDGKGNTLALKNLGGTPAATQCYNKNSTPANQFYLPAQNQLMSLWIAKPVLGTFTNTQYWSSTETSSHSDYAWYADPNTGKANGIVKSNVCTARCVREHSDENIPVTHKVIKGADNKVYIDVTGMPSGTWKSTTLDTEHNETSATNSLFKKIEVDKSDLTAKAGWDTAKTSCAAKEGKWRLPTQRELQLMWIMKDALIEAGVDAFDKDRYWSSVLFSAGSGTPWFIRFSDGYTDNISKSNPFNVRCIREVN